MGGLEDTVGQMEKTLNDYEIRNLHEKYINFYDYVNDEMIE